MSPYGLFESSEKTDARVIGINLFAAQLDYCEDRLFADAIKTSRDWTKPGTYGDQNQLASVDADGWPTEDAEVPVWHGIDRMNGTYYLEGYCATCPTISAGYGGAQIANFSYSGGKFSSDVIYSSTGKDGLLLTFPEYWRAVCAMSSLCGRSRLAPQSRIQQPSHSLIK